MEKRLELAGSLNEIYTKFSISSEKNRSKALRVLERDLARLGGSISACGMTSEVKDFVATLLMFEKVLPTEEGNEGTAESAIENLSRWLRGEGSLEGEFDAT